MIDFLSNIWNIAWWFFSAFVFVAYLIALFSIIGDLVRDRELNGLAKAIWLLFLVFLPFLTALVYLVVRGRGMGDRQAAREASAKAATDAYVRSVAGTGGGPAAEIAQAKQLLDAGAISAEEFAALKASALGRAA